MTLAQQVQAYRLSGGRSWERLRSERMAALPWAVYLKANTSRRLAAEWGISVRVAMDWLQKGVAQGILRRQCRPSRHGGDLYRVARLEVGMPAGTKGRIAH